MAIFTIVGCTKKNNDTNAQVPYTMANLAGNYKVTAETTTIDGVATNTFDSTYPKPCDKLNVYAFTEFGGVTITEGCTGLAQNENYTINGNKLFFSGSDALTISSLTATQLELTESDTIVRNPLNIEMVVTTYTRK